MRFILAAATVLIGAPGATLFAHGSAFDHAVAGLVAALPDPSTAAVMCAGLGLVVGARRARSNAVAD